MTVQVEVLREKGESLEAELTDTQHIYFPSEEIRKGVRGRFFVVIRSMSDNVGAEVYHIDPGQIPNPDNPRGRISPYVFKSNRPVREIVPGEAWPKETTVDKDGVHQIHIACDPY